VKISDSQIIRIVVAILGAAVLAAVAVGIGLLGESDAAPTHPAFVREARFLVSFLIVTTFHVFLRMPIVPRVSVLLLRVLAAQMLLVFSRDSLLPTLLVIAPIGIEIGMVLPGGAVIFGWSAGMVLIALFAAADTAWNVAIATYSRPALAAIGAVFAGAAVLGSSLRATLARLERGVQTAARLQENVLTLTQANLRFMQYAATAEARSKEEERARITRDIHDSIGYALTNILAMARLIVRLASDESEQIVEIAGEVEGQAHEGLLQMRGAVRKLRATRDEPPKGQAAVLRLIRTFSMATGISVKADFSNSCWPEHAAAHDVLYHIVQESLTNSFRHGQATEVSVVFSRAEKGIRVVVEDNGEGAGVVEYGVGLAGMAERARAVGGFTRPESIGNGFRVVGWLPL